MQLLTIKAVQNYILDCYYNDKNNAVFECYNNYYGYADNKYLKDSTENLEIIINDMDFVTEFLGGNIQ